MLPIMTRQNRPVPLLLCILLVWSSALEGLNAFAPAVGWSRQIARQQAIRTTTRTTTTTTSSSTRRQAAFATDVYVEHLYDAYAATTAPYSTLAAWSSSSASALGEAQQLYLDNLAAAVAAATTDTRSTAAEKGLLVGTTDTADVDALWTALWQRPTADDLMTRIAMAADFVPEGNVVASTTEALTTTTSFLGSGVASDPLLASSMNAWDAVSSAAVEAAAATTTDELTSLSTAAAASSSWSLDTAAAGPVMAGGPVLADATSMMSTTPSSETLLRSQLSEYAQAYQMQAATAEVSSSSSSPYAANTAARGLAQAWNDWTHSGQAAWQASSKNALSQAMSSGQAALHSGAETLAATGQVAAKTLHSGAETLAVTGQVAAKTGSVLWGGAKNTVQGLADGVSFVARAPAQLAESTQANVQLVTHDLSIRDLADRMVQGIVALAKTIVTVLNILVEAISGDTLTDLVHKAQTAAADVTSQAVHSVATTIQQIGDMTIAEALSSIAKLVVVVSTILYRIFSGILEVVTGRNVGEWSALAAQAVEQQADAVLTAASTTATDLSDKSLTELVVMLGNLEQEATQAVVATATQVLQAVDVAPMALASLSNLP